ncbi:RidA family protein [Lactobacillus mulieris]|uniref:RidA family protein n=1 Tax=Lactobacillus mulieris TaxID=2508708 RepID=UPI001432F731|nr:RidA family protein [Lactobacillus mulieris]MCF1783275.1 RidA family protein [Lactobacillus mulieris]MCW8104025.1 RidA family protein [Lactobacillus mulieris]MDK6803931.1 RidA family protein [Lactobacillus mulieris]MDK8383087.1 RidA family protein [Lactobacillus mulieris]MDT9621269.1 RidA family protein [Lactobacillus mulieris]
MTPFENVRIVGNLCYVSGQVPVKSNGEIDKTKDFYQLAMESLTVIKNIAEKQNKTVDDIVKTTLYMTDITQLKEANKAYLEIFKDRKPARSALGVSGLAGGVNLEIDAVIALD